MRRRLHLKTVKLQGEANTIPEAQLQEVIGDFRDELQELMEAHGVDASRVFNADQTGLYYRRFPCTTICEALRTDVIKGTKAMKDKDRITVMVCTSSEGEKVPLAYVGKSNAPRCFRDQHPVQHYTANKKAWFNKRTTEWWFSLVFAPYLMINSDLVMMMLTRMIFMPL